MKRFFDTDPDHHSKYVLRRFAAVVNIVGLIAFGVATWAICMMVVNIVGLIAFGVATWAICMMIEWVAA